MNLDTKLFSSNKALADKSDEGGGLVQLVYVSRAVGSENDTALRDILGVARGHNAEQGITGMLCFAYGRYLQVLEGPSDAVNALFLKIAGDRRHTGMRLTKFSQPKTRLFALWSMRLICLDESSSGEARALVRFNGFGAFEPERWSGEECLGFLTKLSRVIPAVK